MSTTEEASTGAASVAAGWDAKIKGWIAGALLAGTTLGGSVSSALGSSGVSDRIAELRAEVKESQADLKEEIKSLRRQVSSAASDRWTRADHNTFAAQTQRQHDRFDGRMDRMERALDRLSKGK